MKQHLKVVAAVIVKDDKIYIGQRQKQALIGGFWEFPGGKIENGETDHQALTREIDEELGIEINIGSLIDEVNYSYDEFDLTLRCYWASLTDSEPISTVHSQTKWVTKQELREVKIAPANLRIVEKISRSYMDCT